MSLSFKHFLLVLRGGRMDDIFIFQSSIENHLKSIQKSWKLTEIIWEQRHSSLSARHSSSLFPSRVSSVPGSPASWADTRLMTPLRTRRLRTLTYITKWIYCFVGRCVHTSSRRVVKFAAFFWVILSRHYHPPLRCAALTWISVTCPKSINFMNISNDKHQPRLSPGDIIRNMSPVLASFLPAVTYQNAYSRRLSIVNESRVFHGSPLLQVWRLKTKDWRLK